MKRRMSTAQKSGMIQYLIDRIDGILRDKEKAQVAPIKKSPKLLTFEKLLNQITTTKNGHSNP